VGHLKGSAISINGEEPIIAGKFFNTVHCPDKLLCKGICKHIGIGYSTLDSFMMEHNRSIENNVLSISQDYLIRSLSDFLEMQEENRFKFNKQLYFENFQKETEIESRFCEKYDLSKIESEIMKLPDEIKLVSREEYAEGYEEEREYRVEDIIDSILANAEISSKLSVNDTLKCAKATCILLSGEKCVPIENSGVLIYYVPYLEKYILAKLKMPENVEENMVEDIPEGEESKIIIEKKDKFFYVSHPYYELYFKLFDEDVNKLVDGLINLKKI